MLTHKSTYSVLLLCLALASACGGDATPGGSNGAQPELSDTIPVKTAVIAKGDVIDYVRAVGTISPIHDARVASQTAGTITEVYVEVGDRVRKQQALVQVDPEMKELALQQAEARLLEAKAAFDKATRDYERNKSLFESKDISEYIFETARLQKQSAKAAFLTAQAGARMARRQLLDARIKSPVDGLVASRFVELGSTVAPGAPVAKVVDISTVKVKFGVPERDVVKLAKGLRAAVLVDSYPGEQFEGTISSVGPQADLTTRTFPVEVTVRNPESRLKAGMVARVEIAAQGIQGVSLLPRSAILERGGETVVFVVENGIAYKRMPKLGLESGDYVAILAGVETGARVVVVGQENLVEGARVDVKDSLQD